MSTQQSNRWLTRIAAERFLRELIAQGFTVPRVVERLGTQPSVGERHK